MKFENFFILNHSAAPSDAFGTQNMYGEDKIDASVEPLKFDDYGHLCHIEAEDVYESGRKYRFVVRTTNYTEKLYNYKKRKPTSMRRKPTSH